MPRMEDLLAEGQGLIEVGGAIVAADLATQAELDAVSGAYARLSGESHADVAVASTTVKTALSTLATPTGLDVGDRLIFRYGGTVLNNSGATVNFRWQWDLGTAAPLDTTATAFVTSANPYRWYAEIVVAVEAVATAHRITGLFLSGTTSSGSFKLVATGSAGGLIGVANATAAQDLSTTKNAVLYQTMSAATATCTLTQASVQFAPYAP